MQQRDADGRPRAGRALRAGDPQAPRLLIERYQGVVFGLCYRMMSHQQDAEDVAQETFVRALRSMAGFDDAGRSAPGCWRSPPIAAARHWPAGPAGRCWRCRAGRGAARPAGRAGRPRRPGRRARASLGALRPEYRLVFVLFHEQNLSYEEIARAVTRPVGTVKTWLHRARAQLAEDLSRRGVHVKREV